jgi:hypothetical protein
MKTSVKQIRFLLAFLSVVCAAMAIGVGPASADLQTPDLSLTRFDFSRDTTQAGGHPNVKMLFRFCDNGVTVQSATPATADTPIEITLTDAVTLPAGSTVVIVRDGQGLPAMNGQWTPELVPGTGNKTLRLIGTAGTAGGNYVAGSAKVLLPIAYGCTDSQRTAYIKDFTLKLPPGMLGNPTSTVPCPYAVWIVTACPPESQLGYSWTNALIDSTTTPSVVFTPVYNVETMGLEPARLGTAVFPSDPAGPFPITINVRTTGDRGLDSALINIPRNLGGPRGLPMEIATVLCARVPCVQQAAANHDITGNSATYDAAHSRPFFVNPTSCTPKKVALEARSWHTGAVTRRAEVDVTSTGCDNVPFDLGFDVDPSPADEGGTTQAGQPSGQTVVLQYPRKPTCDDPNIGEPGDPTCTYEDEDIWEAQLKDIAQSLPEGLGLSPGGGVGLEGCTFGQFGVDSAGNQVNDNAVECPAGSQIGTLKVTSPVIENPVGGRVFFGPTTDFGRPTADNPWKLFLLIEGAGLRIKLVGDVTVGADGTVSNVFLNQPELPFSRLELHLNGGDHAVLMNPTTCGAHNGSAHLTGWNGKTHDSTPSMDTTLDGIAGHSTCPPPAFNPTVDEATATPKQAGANSVSRIVISRPDGNQNIKNIRLSLPAGAVGSLAAVPKCSLADPANCPNDTRIGTVKNTVGAGNGLLTAEGGLYLGEAAQPGDAASIIIDVPAKTGPIDLGDVVLVSRVILRQSDTGVDVITEGVPQIFEGVKLPLRKIEITVDRPGFFINPTGCDTRPLIATFESWDGATSTSSVDETAEGCDALPFNPQLRLIAGAPGLTSKGSHPPLSAILTQQPGEANIKQAKVVLPDILRPNVPEFNEPGGLCAEADFVVRNCPAGSLVGNARVITPVLPFELSGPVYVVQETVDPLPRLFVLLRGGGFEVPLKARNFFEGIKIVNLFETVPDVPQTYFELNIDGGPHGILNAFFDMCKASPRAFDTRFTGQNGKVVAAKPLLEVKGCEPTVSAASIRTGKVKVKGRTAKIRVSCRQTKPCQGRLTLTSSGKVKLAKHTRKKSKVKFGSARFNIAAKKSKTVSVRISAKGMKALKANKRVRVSAKATVTGSKSATTGLTLVK